MGTLSEILLKLANPPPPPRDRKIINMLFLIENDEVILISTNSNSVSKSKYWSKKNPSR